MTKHLKDMSIEELQAGYEKGKVTDEEIEQKRDDYTIWLSHQISLCKKFKYHDMKLAYEDSLRQYQKLKDND